MGRFDVNNEEKAPSDAKKRGKGFSSGNTVRREDFAGTSKALNTLQVKFDCGEGKERGRFLECLQLTTAYLITKLEGGGDVKMSIRNWESLRAGMAGPGQTQSSGHEGHAAGGVWDEGEEGGKSPHQPEHCIWPSARAVYGLTAVTSRGAGEMGSDVERAGPAWAN